MQRISVTGFLIGVLLEEERIVLKNIQDDHRESPADPPGLTSGSAEDPDVLSLKRPQIPEERADPEEEKPGETIDPEEEKPGETIDPEDTEKESPKSSDTLVAAMEAILFAMGDSVPVDSIAQALEITADQARAAAGMLADRYRGSASGLVLNWYGDSLQLSTKPELYDCLIRIASEPKKPKLTPTLMETLSIIAFRQPVTRLEVEQIRGVNSDFAISRLVSFDLVQEVGRKEVPGRPLLFGTTEQFLRSFGIRSLEDLPEPDLSLMEVFQEEAEEEVASKLNI